MIFLIISKRWQLLCIMCCKVSFVGLETSCVKVFVIISMLHYEDFVQARSFQSTIIQLCFIILEVIKCPTYPSSKTFQVAFFQWKHSIYLDIWNWRFHYYMDMHLRLIYIFSLCLFGKRMNQNFKCDHQSTIFQKLPCWATC